MEGFSSAFKRWIFCAGVLSPLSATADSVYVFCVQQEDRNNWHWLSTDNPTAQGEWQRFSYEGNTYEGFRVTPDEYQRLSDLCSENELPQPANSYFSKWHLFIVQNDKQTRLLAPGFLHDQPPSEDFVVPSELFKPYEICEPSDGSYWSTPVCTFRLYPENI